MPADEGLEARLAPLRDIGRLIRDQDGRATALPIFLVQQRRRIYGFDASVTDDAAWLTNGEGEVDPDLTVSLEAGWKASRHEPDGYSRVGYVDEWECVTACFTEAATEDYIRANRHNLTDPRTYAATGYRNPEWQAVREFLLWLAGPAEGAP